MRLIDADEMLVNENEAFISAQEKVENTATYLVNDVVHKKIRMLINDTPTVDAEPVRHGKWKDAGLGFMMLYACTHCGKQALFHARPYPFCPNCGAKMDAQEAEE